MTRVRGRFRIGSIVAIGSMMAGCGGSEPPPGPPPRPAFPGTTLVVAALGDTAILAGLRAQQGEWSASTRAEVAFLDQPADPKSPGKADLLVFPGDRLGDLVDVDALLVLPDDAILPPPPAPKEGQESSAAEPPPDPLAFKEVAAPYREQVTRYGDDRLALPIGGTALVLAFRRDAFDLEANKAAAKAAGVALEPPKTWAELDGLAKFLHGRDWDGDGKPDSGIALAWGADPEGVGDTAFLARAASLGQHRDQYSFLFDSDRMGPRVASPPFVEALEATIGLARLAPEGAAKFDADAARGAFRSGKVALLIDRAERASAWGEGKPIGVAPLPGSDKVYNPDRKRDEPASPPNRPSYLPCGGGWLVGVARSTAHKEAAIDLAKYLAGPDVTDRLRADRAFPMLATRTPQLAKGPADPRSAPGVEARSWSDAVGRTINAPRVVVGLRVPEAEAYLADLTRGRVEAANGRPAAEALQAVADAWAARTQSLGPTRQAWHYRRSLNRLVTTPDPPPRGH